MATPIKAVPILSGKTADEFVRRAEENERKHHATLSEEQEQQIAEIMKRAHDFIPSWLKK